MACFSTTPRRTGPWWERPRWCGAGTRTPPSSTPSSPGHDPDSPKDAPRWFAVDIRAEDPLPVPVTLEAMRVAPALRDFPLLRRGQRLSVLPVSAREWEAVLRLGMRS